MSILPNICFDYKVATQQNQQPPAKSNLFFIIFCLKKRLQLLTFHFSYGKMNFMENKYNQIKLFSCSKYTFTESNLRTMNYHRHNTLELTYVSAGELFFEYMDKNGVECSFSLKQNQVAIIKPGTIHKTSVAIGLQSYGLELISDNDILESIKQNDFVKTLPAFKSLLASFDDIMVFDDSKNILNTIKQFKMFMQPSSGDDEYSQLLFSLELRKLLLQILACKKPVDAMNISNYHVSKAIKYIQGNFNRDIKTSDLANHLGISSDYFQKIFHRTMNIKFNEYLNKQRVEYAKRLLLSSPYTLDQICGMVGYKSLPTLIYNFKKVTNTTPSQYKAQMIANYRYAIKDEDSPLYQQEVIVKQQKLF